MLKRDLQFVLCLLSEVADNLIDVIHLLEDICIDMGDEV